MNKKIYEKVAEKQQWCQLCGCSNNLNIHHIIFGKMHGTRNDLTTLDNLIRLCNKCHLEVHRHKKKYIPILQEKLKEVDYED